MSSSSAAGPGKGQPQPEGMPPIKLWLAIIVGFFLGGYLDTFYPLLFSGFSFALSLLGCLGIGKFLHEWRKR